MRPMAPPKKKQLLGLEKNNPEPAPPEKPPLLNVSSQTRRTSSIIKGYKSTKASIRNFLNIQTRGSQRPSLDESLFSVSSPEDLTTVSAEASTSTSKTKPPSADAAKETPINPILILPKVSTTQKPLLQTPPSPRRQVLDYNQKLKALTLPGGIPSGRTITMAPCIASTFGELANGFSSSNILMEDWGLEEYESQPTFIDVDCGILLGSNGLPRRARNKVLRPMLTHQLMELESTDGTSEPPSGPEDPDQKLLQKMRAAVFVLEVVEIDSTGDEIENAGESNAVSIGMGLFLCCAHGFVARDSSTTSLRYLARLRRIGEKDEFCHVAVLEYGCAYQNVHRLLPHKYPIARDDDWAILRRIPASSIYTTVGSLSPIAHPGLTTYEPLKMAGQNMCIVDIVGHLKKHYPENLRHRLPVMKAAINDLHPGRLSMTYGTGIRGNRVPVNDGSNTYRFTIDVCGHFVQYDISCTPGTSGSAILDDNGDWIGMHQSCLMEYIDGRKQVTKESHNQGILLSHPRLKAAVMRQFNQLEFYGEESTVGASINERDDIVTSWRDLGFEPLGERKGIVGGRKGTTTRQLNILSAKTWRGAAAGVEDGDEDEEEDGEQ